MKVKTTLLRGRRVRPASPRLAAEQENAAAAAACPPLVDVPPMCEALRCSRRRARPLPPRPPQSAATRRPQPRKRASARPAIDASCETKQWNCAPQPDECARCPKAPNHRRARRPQRDQGQKAKSRRFFTTGSLRMSEKADGEEASASGERQISRAVSRRHHHRLA